MKCRFIANLDELKLYRKSLSVQKQIGGKVVFVEYEKDRPKLLDFYKRHSFEEFKAPSDADAGDKLGQLFRFLK